VGYGHLRDELIANKESGNPNWQFSNSDTVVPSQDDDSFANSLKREAYSLYTRPIFEIKSSEQVPQGSRNMQGQCVYVKQGLSWRRNSYHGDTVSMSFGGLLQVTVDCPPALISLLSNLDFQLPASEGVRIGAGDK